MQPVETELLETWGSFLDDIKPCVEHLRVMGNFEEAVSAPAWSVLVERHDCIVVVKDVLCIASVENGVRMWVVTSAGLHYEASSIMFETDILCLAVLVEIVQCGKLAEPRIELVDVRLLVFFVNEEELSGRFGLLHCQYTVLCGSHDGYFHFVVSTTVFRQRQCVRNWRDKLVVEILHSLFELFHVRGSWKFHRRGKMPDFNAVVLTENRHEDVGVVFIKMVLTEFEREITEFAIVHERKS